MPTQIQEKKVEEVKVQTKVAEPEQTSQPVIKASKPLSKPNISSGFSINSFLNQEEKTEEREKTTVVNTENLPEHHFTDTDIQTEWTVLLKQLRTKDPVVFNAIKAFKLIKIDEKIIEISYPSDSAKIEFDKISIEFFNHFKHKVHNHSIEFQFKKDHENLKIEVMTKKKIFEKFIEMNPLLKDLDDLMRFDLS
ncbi:hypothetical protein OF897_13730 [Chryseobacterium formosus]|uniref:DNA polymerase-3 subunit gamma/tau n=1 Tax=Chryseobacterium formosus TaxID=1537363 RepID=A0ABT3XS70_9FLAO|nr:hypothetical protein [Chryseobacterium formosus]MCX8524974.1 hypothetical protein [Chryseobacterium formosus]